MNNIFEKEAMLEQYKLYVESAEKVSDRRNQANVLFMSINSAIIAVFSFLKPADNHDLFNIGNLEYAFVFLVLIILNIFWRRLIISYRQLNTAKFKVIGEIEKQLPLSPFYKMEWTELGEGKNPELYVPLSKTETTIPVLLIIIYSFITIGILLKLFLEL